MPLRRHCHDDVLSLCWRCFLRHYAIAAARARYAVTLPRCWHAYICRAGTWLGFRLEPFCMLRRSPLMSLATLPIIAAVYFD